MIWKKSRTDIGIECAEYLPTIISVQQNINWTGTGFINNAKHFYINILLIASILLFGPLCVANVYVRVRYVNEKRTFYVTQESQIDDGALSQLRDTRQPMFIFTRRAQAKLL